MWLWGILYCLMMDFKTLEEARIDGGGFSLNEFSLFSLKGRDCKRFLQGQLTNDVLALKGGQSQLTARLNRVGQLLGWAYLAKMTGLKEKKWGEFILLVPQSFQREFIEDLKKFIIMDDVEILALKERPHGLMGLGHQIHLPRDANFFYLNFNGEHCICFWGEDPLAQVPPIDPEVWKGLEFLSGQPLWNQNIFQGQLVNETVINSLGVSYSKGCFLGQETAAKVETRRGAAYVPALLVLDGPSWLPAEGKEIYEEGGKKVGRVYSSLLIENRLYLQAALGREQRIEGRKLSFSFKAGEGVQGEVRLLPFFPYEQGTQRARAIYERGAEAFRENREDRALEIFRKALFYDPCFADAYESLGVILGRQGKYEEALAFMDKLLEVEPHSVMAHTNKSLYLMKLGKIEEAEEEKALATVAGFTQLGKKAGGEKAHIQARKEKEREWQHREKMFKQVLEIDSHDILANYGMGEIYFQRKEFEQALSCLEKVMVSDSRHTRAYLLGGKTLVALKERDRAFEILEKGIGIAAQSGDFKSAHEMQAILNKL